MNYLRVFSEISGSRLCMACDADEARLRGVRDRHQLLATTTDWQEVIADRWVDAVVIATPASTHFEVARCALAAGKHVLVEKPLASTVAQARELAELGERSGLVLMVGHTFLYNDGVRKMKELVSAADFGRVYYLHATRTNLGPIRSDVSTIWDLATHDVAIFNYLLGAVPAWVSAVGSRVFSRVREDVVFATLGYGDGIVASAHASWLDPNKVRELVVVGSRQRIVFDDLNNVERVRIFEKGVAAEEKEADSFGQFRLLVRDGDIISPWVPPSEPLRNVAIHFLECIRAGKPPLTDGKNGLDVVRVLSAIDRSVAANGAPVEVE
jgi:predicted dehydrogenase